jgi:type IV pilus assembly protein PilW
VSVQSLASDTLTTASKFSITSVYPVGTPVMWLRCITYAIGTTAAKCGNAPCLLRGLRNSGTYASVNNDPGMIPIAEGIEDLQLAYACDGCNGSVADGIIDDQDASGTFTAGDFISNNTWTASPTTPDTIRLVRISLVARQSGLDLQTGDTNRARAATPNPIVAEDHNPSSDAGFSLTSYQWQRRRLVTRTVQLRNMGL